MFVFSYFSWGLHVIFSRCDPEMVFNLWWANLKKTHVEIARSQGETRGMLARYSWWGAEMILSVDNASPLIQDIQVSQPRII